MADIVIPNQATEMEIYAADELKKYLQLSTDAVFSIVQEKEVTSKFNIYLGKTDKALEIAQGEYECLEQDAFCICTARDSLLLFGRENIYSQSATLYAVYDFLEKFLGIKFYTCDEEVVPHTDFIELGEARIKEKPDFITRQPLFATQRKQPEFAAKLRIKDCYIRRLPGGALEPEWGTGQGHNFFHLIPPDVYERIHPEWFDKENGELCFSQESLVDELTVVLKKKIDEKPQAKYFALSQNDTVNPCQCEKCKKNYEKYGVTGTMLRMVNRVAQNIDDWAKEKYPNREIYIVTFAYYFSIKPPVIKTESGAYVPIDDSCVPYKNVYIFFTTIDFCFYHSLFDTGCTWNKEFLDIFYGWQTLVGDRMHVWNYGANYSHYLYPFFNFDTIQENYRFFKKNGLSSYMLEHGTCEGEYVEFAELRTYLTSKLMWNVDVDLEKEGVAFIDTYYKEAAAEIKAYLRVLRERLKEIDEECGYHLRVYHLPEEMFAIENFPMEFLNVIKEIFERGFRKIEKISDVEQREVIKKRFMRVSLSARYLLLMNYDGYGLTDKETFIEQYLADAKYCGIKKYKEQWQGDDHMSELAELARKGEVLKY